MHLRVITLAQYLTASHTRQSDYHATKFVKAVKGLEFKGYASVPVCGRREHLDGGSAVNAMQWAAEMAHEALVANGLLGPFSLVPMPSSMTTLAIPRTEGRAHLLARAMAKRHASLYQVLDLLSFRSPMQPSRQGGTRDPRELRAAMVADYCTSIDDPPLLIVDDVLTTGAHFKAAWVALLEIGWGAVVAGLAVGRSQSWVDENPFEVKTATYPHPLVDDPGESAERGECLVCRLPALVEFAYCPKCGADADAWAWEAPLSVVDGVAYFEDGAPDCPKCGHSPLEFAYNGLCSLHHHQAERDD